MGSASRLESSLRSPRVNALSKFNDLSGLDSVLLPNTVVWRNFSFTGEASTDERTGERGGGGGGLTLAANSAAIRNARSFALAVGDEALVVVSAAVEVGTGADETLSRPFFRIRCIVRPLRLRHTRHTALSLGQVRKLTAGLDIDGEQELFMESWRCLMSHRPSEVNHQVPQP